MKITVLLKNIKVKNNLWINLLLVKEMPISNLFLIKIYARKISRR